MENMARLADVDNDEAALRRAGLVRVSDDVRTERQLLPKYPWFEAPAGAGVACWLCGNLAVYVTGQHDDATFWGWCERHAHNF